MAMMNEMEYRTIGSALAGGYRAAVYCRLSKDDDLQGESASIANQRDMLEKYCEKQGWEVVAVYQDDGFTGLNMERPDLQRMLRAIERRQINLVITKDLSRLGRNYLQTGHLIEDFFPRNGVRYIAMNDGIDTLRDNNDIAPFKNILNEMYSKDISKKVHSSYLLKAQKGQFTGCLAPFGYRKDPEDKNHLLIDEETAPIVRLIFGYALNGHGPNYIRRRLEEEKIPCPTWWNRERGLRNTRTKWEKKDPENGRYMWDFSVIKDLLMNPVYTGAIASQKKDYRFKIGTIGEKKPEDWIVVEGQHEPLIDRMSFDIVQNKLKSRQRPGQTNEISLFAGLIKCGECGKSLTVRYTNAKHPQQIYSCKTYNAFGKNHCTQHRIDYDTLYSHVLRKIRECARAALMDGEAVADRLTNTCEAEQREQREAMERSLTRDEERIEVLDKMVMRLYEDMIAGRISEQNFNTMLEKTQTEQTELKTKVSEGRKRLSDEVQLANDAKQWVEAIQEYANITELDAATLNRLIKEIVVHRQLPNQMPIHWNSVGEANGFIGKNIGAWGIPLFMLAIHLVVAIKTENDKSKQHLSVITKGLCFWAVPLASVIFVPLSLFKAAGYGLNITKIVLAIVGVLFIVAGNYLPKNQPNSIAGYKLPWTKNNPDNWNKTHRFAGAIWVICGFVYIIISFIPLDNGLAGLTILATIIALLAPIIYSYIGEKVDSQNKSA